MLWPVVRLCTSIQCGFEVGFGKQTVVDCFLKRNGDKVINNGKYNYGM